ncbi:MAG: hypothetical protein SGI92_08210 [Bryobacteraceae bacterium]|nr:hypothetical protein [Bryobacteraceae bacterium]
MSDHSEYREEFQDEHPHEYDHSEPQYSIISILGGLTVVLLLVVGIAIAQYYSRTEESLVQNTVLTQPSWVLQDLRNKENWELTHYDHYDRKRGTMRLPVEQAMKLVADDAASNKEKYPTGAYAVKSAALLAAAGAQPGAPGAAGAAPAAANATQGATSSPNVQTPSSSQQPHK